MNTTLENKADTKSNDDIASLDRDDKQELADLREQIKNGWKPYFVSSKSELEKAEKIINELGATKICYHCFEDSVTGNNIHLCMYK